MAKREFNLPGIQDLSKEQEDARALPKQGQHLIIGGPGTGKSVLALLRSRRHQQDKEDYVFLVYNKLLNQASRQLFGLELNSQQWQSWIMRTFEAMHRVAMPRFLEEKNGWREIDWHKASEIIAASQPTEQVKRPFLIIDEGQDMPPEFYQTLTNLGFENFYVVADQNQQIVPGQNSTRQDIQNSLGIASADVIELQDNYRNMYPIARLAREFYTGDPASPPPELPNRPSVVVLIILPHFLLNKIHEISRICLNKLPVGPRQEKHHWESDLGPLCLVVATGKLRQLGKTALIAFGSWGFAPEVGFLRHKRAANIRPIDHHVTGDQ